MSASSFEHEKALRERGITAEVIHDGIDRVLVALSIDALDDLIDGYVSGANMDDRIAEAYGEGEDHGRETGSDDGYEAACDEIKNEDGEAWDIVKPMLQEAHETGYQDALDDIASLA